MKPLLMSLDFLLCDCEFLEFSGQLLVRGVCFQTLPHVFVSQSVQERLSIALSLLTVDFFVRVTSGGQHVDRGVFFEFEGMRLVGSNISWRTRNPWLETLWLLWLFHA